MPKIYLSPAVHEHDNPCSFQNNCSENTHANQYLDTLIPYLDACGIAYRRHDAADKGTSGVNRAVRESNAYQPDLHYVVHTNAYNGTVQGSRPQIYKGSAKGREYAEKILVYRRQIYPYPCSIFERTDLAELKNTVAPCVYEELIFHDSLEDASWLHNHMRLLAEYTCRAFCDIWALPFSDPYAPQKGDVDEDGQITATDALMALKASTKGIDLNTQQAERADMDGDGTITAADALKILGESAGK